MLLLLTNEMVLILIVEKLNTYVVVVDEEMVLFVFCVEQTPMQTPLPTPLPGTADNSSMYNIPTGSSDYPTPGTENGSHADVKARPSPYMVSFAFLNCFFKVLIKTESILFVAATTFSVDKSKA